MAELLRNPTNIGDIFFSGSQSVTKGDEVTWILDDTWAFKATEKCGVSTNASPFVELNSGQTFLIYKRTQADIDAGNSKGIYIFDRDTVVALAYPQEVTQDIVIENDIYNNNLSTIIVEAEKNPTAVIAYSPNPVYQNSSVTVKSESFAVAPATIASYRWVKNGTVISTASQFTYTTSTNSSDSIQLTVTDNGGRKNITQKSIPISAKPIYPDVSFSNTWKYNFGLTDNNWREILSKVSSISGTGTISISTNVNIWTLKNSYVKYAEVRILINGVQRAYGKIAISVDTNQNYIAIASATYLGTMTKSDIITVQVRDATGASDSKLSGGGSSQPDNQLQVSVTNRTS